LFNIAKQPLQGSRTPAYQQLAPTATLCSRHCIDFPHTLLDTLQLLLGSECKPSCASVALDRLRPRAALIN
jgi:hypothetical protein